MSDNAATTLGFPFPDPREQARSRGEEFQRLTPEARFREIFAMMALGLNMANSSPHRAQIQKRWEDEERALNRIYREAFAKHGQ
jgi:hypothetical protein